MTITDTNYYERMASSLDDKQRMFDFLPPVTADYAPQVLDVGTGGGELTGSLLDLGYRVTSIDGNPNAILSTQRLYPEARLMALRAHEVHFLDQEFDAILCSSVMHEVFSYGDDKFGPGHMGAVDRAIATFATVLKPGGILVIRDGVKPDDAEKQGVLYLKDDSDDAIWEYLRLNPWANGHANGGRIINLRRNRSGTFYGNRQSIMEFAFTYNWGVENFHREALELYGIMKLEEYVKRVERFGFSCFHAESYVQDGYIDGLTPLVKILDDRYKPLPMFKTNALWAYRIDS